MARRLKHRGPDDEGFFMEGPVALGHRRLSIIDLDGGHQPMFSVQGTQAIVFNGEIYNYRELRRELIEKGHQFRTSSDTEVILASYQQWGIHCLDRFNGMFAFALWDKNIHKLWLARDRLGEKPLYYAAQKGRFYFASEAKAFWEIPSLCGQLDARAIDQYLTYRYVPSERTFYKDIKKLKAGHWMTVDNTGRIESVRQWWALPQTRDESHAITPAIINRFTDQFQELFSSAVRLRMVADVPVGMFLSSGIDSVSIASEMPLTASSCAFTIGFNVEGDEIDAARMVAKSLGGKHREIFFQDKDFNSFSDALSTMDEPYGDPIILPTYVLAAQARRLVKVVLAGDGGDELLGGYIHQEFFRRMPDAMPSTIYKMMGCFARFTPVSVLDRFFNYPASMGQAGRDRLQQLLNVYPDAYGSYRIFASIFSENDRRGFYTSDFAAQLSDGPDGFNEEMRNHFLRKDLTAFDKVLQWDMKTWFPEQALMKLDRLSMAHGLEARCPFADHRLAEILFQMPLGVYKVLSANKNVLRRKYQQGRPYLSKKKRAFYLPFHQRYRAAFDRLQEETLTPEVIKAGGVFKYDAIAKLLKGKEHSPLLVEKQVTSIVALMQWMKNTVEIKEN